MKSFKKFLSEIVTQASTQATKMGLKGDGHGDWYDKEGNLVAKTVNAKLKFNLSFKSHCKVRFGRILV